MAKRHLSEFETDRIAGSLNLCLGCKTIMRSIQAKKLYNYWNNLRGSRPAPDRREIEPSDIRDILADTFILEIDQTYRSISFRLAGTRLCSAYGKELKGYGFLGLWAEASNLDVFQVVQGVYQNSKPAVLSYLAETEGEKTVNYEMLLLPIHNGTSNSLRILGVATCTELPNWLGEDPIINNRLKSYRYLEPEAIQSPSLVPDLQDLADVKQDDVKQVAHLTVIKGGLS